MHWGSNPHTILAQVLVFCGLARGSGSPPTNAPADGLAGEPPP